jgi:uncharacterized membrane protein HdeD (DUF308 family)
MADHTAQPDLATPPLGAALRDTARQISGHWWLSLVSGIAWLVVSLVILQFDAASVTTVAIIVGFMFLFAGIESVALATLPYGPRWVSALVAVLFLIAAVVCFVDPQQTVAGFADMLGFLFLIVGVWWMVRSFLERALNPSWWVGLVSGILMTALAFWTAGQFFFERVYVVLVLAGIWALMQGIGSIVRAFATRRLHQDLAEDSAR